MKNIFKNLTNLRILEGRPNTDHNEPTLDEIWQHLDTDVRQIIMEELESYELAEHQKQVNRLYKEVEDVRDKKELLLSELQEANELFPDPLATEFSDQLYELDEEINLLENINSDHVLNRQMRQRLNMYNFMLMLWNVRRQ